MITDTAKDIIDWIDLGGIVQDFRDIFYILLTPASVKLSKYTEEGKNAFNRGDWIRATNDFSAAKKLTSKPTEQALFRFLQDYSEGRIQNLPSRPVEDTLRKQAAKFGVIIPSLCD